MLLRLLPVPPVAAVGLCSTMGEPGEEARDLLCSGKVRSVLFSGPVLITAGGGFWSSTGVGLGTALTGFHSWVGATRS